MISELVAVACEDGPDRCRLEVAFEPAPGTVEPLQWSYEVDAPEVAVPDLSVLPALPAAFVLACRLSQDLRVVEPLPPSVHEGARHVGATLARWYGLRPAELIAPLAPEPARPPWLRRRGGHGLFFTRGVDSWGTLLRLLDGPAADRPTHLIAVDGDVHLPDDVRTATTADTRAAAAAIGLPLIVVRTDARAAIDQHTDWGAHTHGSVLAGLGYLLRRGLRRVTVSPTYTGELARPWGSHPELEPAWSLPDLRVVHHDDGELRWERTQRIVDDPRVQASLQVCWEGSSARNCGRCEKCLRLRTALEVFGRQDAFAERFDAAWDPALIDALAWANAQQWSDTIDLCDQAGLVADELRQRWEGVPRRRATTGDAIRRAVQPRLPVVGDPAAGAQVARHLARLGLRVDHRAGADAEPALRADLVARSIHLSAEPRSLGGPWPLAEVRLDHLRPLLDVLGADPEAVEPFPSHPRLPSAARPAQR